MYDDEEEEVRGPDDYLYHVTFSRNLEGIAEEGLQRDAGRGIGNVAYDAHRRGYIFLTEASGVPFWFDRAEQWAFDSSDEMLEEGWVPVVLRVPLDEVADLCKRDDIGSDDAGHDAFKCKTPYIDAEDLEVFTGKEWVSVYDHEAVDLASTVDEEGYFLPDSPLLPEL